MAGTAPFFQRNNMRLLNQAASNLSAVLRAGGHAVRPALADTGIEITNEVRQSMASTRRDPSRAYRRGRRVHLASQPGQPPAPDTGRLMSSYSWRVGTEGFVTYLEVGTNVESAPHLEFGTVIMEARPHLRPAVAKTAVRIGAVIARRIAKEQQAAARGLGSAAARLPGLF